LTGFFLVGIATTISLNRACARVAP
jgi:hypothetical protein